MLIKKPSEALTEEEQKRVDEIRSKLSRSYLACEPKDDMYHDMKFLLSKIEVLKYRQSICRDEALLSVAELIEIISKSCVKNNIVIKHLDSGDLYWGRELAADINQAMKERVK